MFGAGGSGGGFVGTTFDDESCGNIYTADEPFTGRFRPLVPLAGLDSESALGTWRLEIDDIVGGDDGELLSWSLELCPAGFADSADICHDADQDLDGKIGLSELLRVIQFFNSEGLGCDPGSEDGFAPNDPDQDCTPHASDYNPQDWDIALTELLRLIQFYNSNGFEPCPEGEDGFCPV